MGPHHPEYYFCFCCGIELGDCALCADEDGFPDVAMKYRCQVTCRACMQALIVAGAGEKTNGPEGPLVGARRSHLTA